VCSRNRPEFLRDSVQSILEGLEVPAELIVVDQSDRANLALEALSHGETRAHVRYTWTTTRGLSTALNHGIRSARHDVLLFTHDDVFVDREWYQALVDALLSAPAATVVTGRVLPAPAPDGGGRFVPSTKVETTPHSFTGRIWDDVLYPLNMAMHRQTFERVGPFDERLGPGTPYPAAEDNDYGYRLLEAGGRIQYVPAAVVHHRAWRDDLISLRWAYGLGQGGFYAKHFRVDDLYIARRAVRELRRYGALTARCALRGDSRARGYAVSAAALMMGMTRWAFTYRLKP
jgi:GT2 family glycosyltransferase